MTCCAEPDEAPRAALQAALGRPWRAPHFQAPGRLMIEPEVERLREHFGGVGKPLPPPNDLLQETERRLIEGGGDLNDLTPRQVRAIPWFLWTSERQWHTNRRLVVTFLTWAAEHWRAAPRRLWRHYLLHLNPNSVATQGCARWLNQRRDRLPERLRVFSEEWALFQPGQAIDKLALALLTDVDIIPQAQGLGLEQSQVRQSSLMLRVLDRLGAVLTRHPGDCEVTTSLDALLRPLGATPTYRMQGPADLQRAALKSLVEGLVRWADRQGAPRTDETLNLLHWLIGDPRLHPGRWTGIDDAVRRTVEGWLTRITLDAFFRFMLAMKTNAPQMVQQREAFWHGYQKDISRAWLIVGANAQNNAEAVLGKSFGTFARGPNVQPDHLGLLLQIGNLVILEMNKQGSTLFWPAGDPLAPGFYQSGYERAKLMDTCRTGVERFRMTHNPPAKWPDKYSAQIAARTGVRPGIERLGVPR